MSDIDPVQFGRLLNAVETLTTQVAELDQKVETLNGQITGGKGVVMGLLITAGGLGAGATKLLEKMFN
jgi:hypothetical protein